MGIGRGRQRCVQHEGDRDRQPRREPAEEEFAAPGGHLLVRGSDDPLEHLVGREAVPNRFADRGRTAAGERSTTSRIESSSGRVESVTVLWHWGRVEKKYFYFRHAP